MCGIFAYLNAILTKKQLQLLRSSFMNGRGRGPEFSYLDNVCKKGVFGFHRLAINGLNQESNQPIFYNGCILICNGEIYNYKQLIQEHDMLVTTDSDCEVIIHLYIKYGFDYILNMLDGVFAFVLVDLRHESPKMFVSRDPFGVRPLYEYSLEFNDGSDVSDMSGVMDENDVTSDIMSASSGSLETSEGGSFDNVFGFTSEMKTLIPFEKKMKHTYSFEQFQPGTWKEYSLENDVWTYKRGDRYHQLCARPYIFKKDDALAIIRSSLTAAVKKRVLATDRPIACLLSGGLDSSLICALVNNFLSVTGVPLETYSIGLKGSEDLKYARLVASHIKSKHTEIVVEEQDFLDAIPEVVRAIESYDTTTVRASVGNYLVSKYIAANSDAKVIFNGDGSDEVCAGYMYFHKAPTHTHLDHECRRLLGDIHYFDVLRSDRSISSNGLEPRTPFLDRNFVSSYLSIDSRLRCHNIHNYCEKWLLRSAFDGSDLLPKEILWRTKEAFSDGVSSLKKSWYEIIQEHVDTNHLGVCDAIYSKHNEPQTDEQRYYRSLFQQFYGEEKTNTIPYFWMPRFVEGATDASARTLKVYKEQNQSSCEGDEENNII